MAEARGEKGSSKKVFSFAAKKARRVQQKMLQKVGQAEKTTDENYTVFVVNFNKQQLAASRLQKELTKYSSNVKAMSNSTKSFMDLWLELYDSEWKGYSEMQSIIEQKMLLWEDLLRKIQNDLMEPLQLYMSKFPETKKIVERRERKIVDYDYAKRELEAARQNKKLTEVKLQQFEDTYHNAKAAFDEVTDKLYDELPTLFDSRIEFYATLFRNMSTVELKFHEEMAKLDTTYNEVMNQLHEEAESGVHTSRKERISSSDLNPVKNSPVDDESLPSDEEEGGEGDDLSEAAASSQGGGDDVALSRSSSGKGTPTRPHSTSKPPPSKPVRSDSTINDNRINTDDNTKERTESTGSSKEAPPKPPLPEDTPEIAPEVTPEVAPEVTPEVAPEDTPEVAPEDTEDSSIKDDISAPPVEETAGTQEGGGGEEPVTKQPEDTQPNEDKEKEGADVNNDNGKEEDKVEPQESIETPSEEQEGEKGISTELSDIAANPDKESPGVLFKVIAAHPYTGEDEDELSFDKGEIIHVIPYDNPDDEEEGWLMGFIPGTTKRGIFPENFTKPCPD